MTTLGHSPPRSKKESSAASSVLTAGSIVAESVVAESVVDEVPVDEVPDDDSNDVESVDHHADETVGSSLTTPPSPSQSATKAEAGDRARRERDEAKAAELQRRADAKQAARSERESQAKAKAEAKEAARVERSATQQAKAEAKKAGRQGRVDPARARTEAKEAKLSAKMLARSQRKEARERAAAAKAATRASLAAAKAAARVDTRTAEMQAPELAPDRPAKDSSAAALGDAPDGTIARGEVDEKVDIAVEEAEPQPAQPSAEALAATSGLAGRLEVERQKIEVGKQDRLRKEQAEASAKQAEEDAAEVKDAAVREREDAKQAERQAKVDAKDANAREREEAKQARRRAKQSDAREGEEARQAKRQARATEKETARRQRLDAKRAREHAKAVADEQSAPRRAATGPVPSTAAGSDSTAAPRQSRADAKERDDAKAAVHSERERGKAAAKSQKAAHRGVRKADHIVEPPREPKVSFLQRRREKAATKNRPSAARVASVASDTGASSPGGGNALTIVAGVLGGVGLACSLVLAVGAFMAALGTTDANGIYNLISSLCDALVGPLRDVFTFSGTSADMKQAVVAWGLGSMGYVFVGLFAQSFLRSRIDD